MRIWEHERTHRARPGGGCVLRDRVQLRAAAPAARACPAAALPDGLPAPPPPAPAPRFGGHLESVSVIATATTSWSPRRPAGGPLGPRQAAAARRRDDRLPPGPGDQRRGGARPRRRVLRRGAQPQGQAPHRPARSCAAQDWFALDSDPVGARCSSTWSRTYSLGRDVSFEDLTADALDPLAGGPGGGRRARRGAPGRGARLRGGRARHVRAHRARRGRDHRRPRRDRARRSTCRRSSEDAVECLRIESGRPRLGLDMDGDTIPQEAGINERAVSFTKGCYVGQETVARLHYKGKPNRHLRGLRLAAPAARGDEILLGDKVVGRVGSACESPRLGPIALALVRREAGARRRGAGGGQRRHGGRAALHAVTERRDRRRAPRSRHGLTGASPLLGGTLTTDGRRRGAALPRPRLRRPRRHARPAAGVAAAAAGAARAEDADPAAPRTGARLDDWGRSERVFDLLEPVLDFYYRLLVPGRGGGRGERARRRRCAARVEPLRRAPARTAR